MAELPEVRPLPRRKRRGMFVAFALILFVGLVAVGAGILLLLSGGPRIPSRAVLVVPIRGAFRESAGGGALETLLFGETQDVVGLRRALAAAASDDRIRGVLLEIEAGGIGF
ncbi:MAG: hypothetical protein JXP34_06460, partial [Planctomycetes bacterium]|nr:hypothetical protein [Planctomycetota bacterium]